MMPRAAGRAALAVRLAVLALLLATVAGLSGAGEVAAQGTIDYANANDENLIDIQNLAQLDAIRYDLDGDGARESDTTDADWAKYQAAFPNALDGMGCTPGPCAGYELTADLDFDANDDGRYDDAASWNDGKGWIPIGTNPDAGDFGANFGAANNAYNTANYNAIFEGNGHTISNLYIKRDIDGDYGFVNIGLFSRSRTGQFRNVGLVNPYISITRSGANCARGPVPCAVRFTNIGSLVGLVLGGLASVTTTAGISGSWVDGGGITVTQGAGNGSEISVGCLSGKVYNASNGVSASYASCAVNLSSVVDDRGSTDRDKNIAFVGGLLGLIYSGSITASYSRGNVTCRNTGPKACAGLVGQSGAGFGVRNIVSSYATGNVVNQSFTEPFIDTDPDPDICLQAYIRARTGGLTGYHFTASIIDSYATGSVSTPLAGRVCSNGLVPPTPVGGLGTRGGSPGSVANSYWDTVTSGITSSNPGGGTGRTTVQLQTPTGYTGIYANWAENLDGQPGNEQPWDFGTSAQYPILTWRHSALSQQLQRAPQPTVTEYEKEYEPPLLQEEMEAEEEDDGEYVAPPIVYNLNIRFSVKGITLDEGESTTYRVRMSQSPVGHPAKVRIHSNNPDVVVSPTVLTFSSANFRQWQTVKVTTLRDPNDTDESANLAHRGPNLGYGAIIVTVNDTWPGTATETVNGHTVTLRHTLDAPYGVTVTAPETLNADTDITIAGPPSDTPAGAPGYGLGATADARMLADIRVQGTPTDGLDICLPIPAALLTEAGDHPLTLLRYAGGSWTPVAGAERRDDADGAAMLCAGGVTEYGTFAVAYTLPALGAVSDLAATAGDALGTVTLTWTPGANAERHWVAGVKQSDRSKLAVWAAANAMGSHTISGLDAGETYIFTVTAGRGEDDSREWSAWAPWATLTLPAPMPTPTPTPEPTFNPPQYPILR